MRNDDSLVAETVRRVSSVTAPDKIILFGSAATGQVTADSDIDLSIFEPTRGTGARRAPDHAPGRAGSWRAAVCVLYVRVNKNVPGLLEGCADQRVNLWTFHDLLVVDVPAGRTPERPRDPGLQSDCFERALPDAYVKLPGGPSMTRG